MYIDLTQLDELIYIYHLLNEIIEAFRFDKFCFGISEDQCNEFFKTLAKISNNIQLLNLLTKTGINFEKVITNDPKYNDLKEQYIALKNN